MCDSVMPERSSRRHQLPHISPMRDLLPELSRLSAEQHPIGRAVVVHVWGSAPRQTGAGMLVTAGGRFVGSVSGGCIETAVVGEMQEALTNGIGKLQRYGVPNAKAWDLGLACGGSISVWLEPGLRPELVSAAELGGACCATIVDGTPHVGASLLVHDDGRDARCLPPVARASAADEAVAVLAGARHLIETAARDALARSDASAVVDIVLPDGTALTILLERFPRPSTLLIVGAVATAAALVPMAKRLGFRTVVLDGRAAFLTRERFPEADELVHAWPAEGFAQIGLDRGTYVCILSHDPKFDEPALELALRSDARYVGAIGSKKTQAARRASLLEKGFTATELARLHGPIGLDIGGREPSETALSVLAEVVGVRYGSRLTQRN